MRNGSEGLGRIAAKTLPWFALVLGAAQALVERFRVIKGTEFWGAGAARSLGAGPVCGGTGEASYSPEFALITGAVQAPAERARGSNSM